MNVVTGEIEGTAYRRTPHNEPMLLVEIETDRVGMFSLFENAVDAPYHRGTKGTHKQRVCIYESEHEALKKLVRTDEHEKALRDAMGMAPQMKLEGDNVTLGERLRAAEAAVLSAKPGSQQLRAEQTLATVERDIAFEAVRLLCRKPGYRDGMPPLTSAKVVGKGPPPPTQQNLMANQHGQLAEALMSTVRALMEQQAPKGKRGE